MKKLEKLKNIEFLRFLFIILIVFGHTIHYSVYKERLFIDFAPYLKYEKCVVDTFLCVEYFFIIAGFFLFSHLKNKQDNTMEFAINKFIRLWPLLAFSIVLFGVLSLFHICEFYTYGNVLNLFFLFTVLPSGYPVNNPSSWFVCALFWCSIFLHNAYRITKPKVFNFTLGLFVFYAFTALLTWRNGDIPGTHSRILNGISGACLRAGASLGLGYFLGMFWDTISEYVKNFKIKNKIKSGLFFIGVSALEIYIFVFILYHSIFYRIHFSNDILFIITFCALFILFLCKKGLLSKLFENNISVFLGKYTFAIYIMQEVGFAIEKPFIWTNKAFVYAHPYINILASILICVSIGVLSHIFVEKKAVKAFNALVAKIRSTSGLSGGGVVFAAPKTHWGYA